MILLLMALLASVSITGWMLTLDAYFGDERLEDNWLRVFCSAELARIGRETRL